MTWRPFLIGKSWLKTGGSEVRLIRLIVYDLDGTLIDSAPRVLELLNDLRSKRKLCPLSLQELIPWLSLGGREMIQHALQAEIAEVDPLLDQFRSNYLERPFSVSSLYPSVLETLEALNSAGLSLALSTNKPRPLVEAILRYDPLGRHFHFINAGGDLPERKPSAMNLQACLDQAGVFPSEALLVGDSRIDQRMAEALKVPFVFFESGYDDGVRREGVSFGFRQHKEFLSFLMSGNLLHPGIRARLQQVPL